MLFCGDTLFAGGCGRIFEGTAAQMHASLHKLASLYLMKHRYIVHMNTLYRISICICGRYRKPKVKTTLRAESNSNVSGTRDSAKTTIAIERNQSSYARVKRRFVKS